MLTLKPKFQEYIKKIIPEDEMQEFLKFCEKPTRNIIRCNTLKISPNELKKRLQEKWKISQPYKDYPETAKMNHFGGAEKDSFSSIMIIESSLQPGELGRTIEHQTGLYYIQELSSMMSPITLAPKQDESILDLCAAPGSKTTQISALMENKGFIIANDVKIDRIKALASNTERCGCMNIITTRLDGIQLCESLKKNNIKFDKILLDAPCSGQGVIRSDSRVWDAFSENTIQYLSSMQKKLLASCLSILKKDGILVYSTCTFSPEENEEVIQFALDNFPVEIEEFKLPLKTRQGLASWNEKSFNPEIKKCHRIYPQDNDTEGFFVAKLRLTKKP